MLKLTALANLRAIGVWSGVHCVIVAFCQFSAPESVVFDAQADRYFVACAGSDQIMQRAQDGTITEFASLDDTPFGMEIQGDTLFVCVGSALDAFSTTNGTCLFSYEVKGSFLKGVTSDGRFLYVSDMAGKRIVRIDPATNESMDWVPRMEGVPHAVEVDQERERLWVTFWGENAPVRAYDLNTAALVVTVPTTLADIAGITLDCSGKVVISSWTPSRISRFDPDVAKPKLEDLQVDGIAHPGDIDYDRGHGRICVPDPQNGTLAFPVPDGCSEDVFRRADYETVQVTPDPTTGLLCLELGTEGPERYMVFSAQGRLLAGGSLRSEGCLDLYRLGPGDFLIEIPHLKRYLQFTVPASGFEPSDRSRVASVGRR